jgi:hypothetical protein
MQNVYFNYYLCVVFFIIIIDWFRVVSGPTKNGMSPFLPWISLKATKVLMDFVLMDFSFCVIHKKGMCPSSGGINRLMMKGLTAFTPWVGDQMAMGLTPLTFAVFFITKSVWLVLVSRRNIWDVSANPVGIEWHVCMFVSNKMDNVLFKCLPSVVTVHNKL